MEINTAIEIGSHSEQAEALCFRQTKKCGRFDFFEAAEGRATGCIKQLSFEKKFFLADMDYKYNRLTSKHYHEPNKFIEILFLESAKGINWEYDAGKFPFEAGINVGLNRGNAGELIFFPDVPIRGIKVMVFEEFYLNYLKDKLSEGPANIHSLVKLNNQNYSNPELELVFKQIKHSMKSGITSELYYEGKIMEILYLVTSEIGTDSLQSHITKRRLTVEDKAAVSKAKSLIEERLAETPKISELAFLTGTSAAKLQNDFQLAFDSTIHGYVIKARMKEALRKIDSTDEPIYSIAQSVGCKNPSRFAELFKKTYGITPMEYRTLRNNR